MNYKKALKEQGSIRKAAEHLGLTKSKFMVAYKKQLGLCTATTACKNKPEEGKTRCLKHLRYAALTQDKERKRITYKNWSEENKEHRAEYMSNYQKENKEKVNALHRKWNKTKKGKTCNREKRARRRASKLNATPSWVDKKELKRIYKECPKGFEVDHIIPLQNDIVCGLHVPWNLQYLTPEENYSKANKFE